MIKDKFVTGSLGSSFGIDGSVRLYTENRLSNLKREKFLTLIRKGKESQFEIKEVKERGDKKYISFIGVDSPEDAKRLLTGSKILISRENACPLQEGEVYLADLIGLEVWINDKKVGEVKSWLEGAWCVMLEVKRSDGGICLIPYNKHFLSEPDFNSGRIELLIEDLLK